MRPYRPINNAIWRESDRVALTACATCNLSAPRLAAKEDDTELTGLSSQRCSRRRRPTGPFWSRRTSCRSRASCRSQSTRAWAGRQSRKRVATGRATVDRVRWCASCGQCPTVLWWGGEPNGFAPLQQITIVQRETAADVMAWGRPCFHRPSRSRVTCWHSVYEYDLCIDRSESVDIETLLKYSTGNLAF